jgi:hypothetical protein
MSVADAHGVELMMLSAPVQYTNRSLHIVIELEKSRNVVILGSAPTITQDSFLRAVPSSAFGL